MAAQTDTSASSDAHEAGEQYVVKSLHLKNFRRFERADIEFHSGLNVLVGGNDQGKSTVIGAINLALTGRWQGNLFSAELNPHFITSEVAREYLETLRESSDRVPDPPEIVVEVHLEETPATQHLRGNNNDAGLTGAGIRLRAALDAELRSDYEAFVRASPAISRVPTEFYKVDWNGFHGVAINPRALPVRAAIIDASRIRLQSGTDYYLKQIVTEALEPAQRTALSAGYRAAQEAFAAEDAIGIINTALASKQGEVTKKTLTLNVDNSQSNQWDGALTPHLDNVPFSMLGSGEQSKLKIMLALARRASQVGIILIEEPENHLAFGELNKLIRHIRDQCNEHQLIIATHSSFVINKLGLSNLLLLAGTNAHSLTALPKGTSDYFAKLSGYDTLRLVLAEKVVLVEGPSDELIVQKAYWDKYAKLPIEDGIDVINVRGLSAPRFLQLARPLRRRCVVVTDNDGRYLEVKKRYAEYENESFIDVCIGHPDEGPTLEPQLARANGEVKLGAILGEDFRSEDEAVEWMKKKKTEAAVRIFSSNEKLDLPEYLVEAIDALSR